MRQIRAKILGPRSYNRAQGTILHTLEGMAGQPTKYHKKFCEMLLKYFNVDPAKKVKEFPTLAGFAIRIGVHRDTLHEWSKVHPEFDDVYRRAKDFQERFLVNRGLKGELDTAFGIFTAKNVLGWRDRQPGEEDKINIQITLADRMAKARARVKKE
jgi:hypothetical protein